MDDMVDFQMLRNLRDAGCNSLEIDRFFRFRTPVDFGNSSN